MNWTLVVSALEKHCRMAQAAVSFARQQRRGQLYVEAMQVLAEANGALASVQLEMKRRAEAKQVPTTEVNGG